MNAVIGFGGFLILVTTIVGLLLAAAAKSQKRKENYAPSRRAHQPWDGAARNGRGIR